MRVLVLVLVLVPGTLDHEPALESDRHSSFIGRSSSRNREAVPDAVTEHRVARSTDVAEGKGIAVDVGDRRIALFRHEGELFAIDETCPHRGGPLHEGPVEGGVVLCPWHQWRFDLRTGASPVNPLSRVRTYPVRVEGEEILVDLDS